MEKYDWRFFMPWCPKCKNEYVSGITKCSDCNVDLVETFEEINFSEEDLIPEEFQPVKSSSDEGSSFLKAADSPMYTKASERKEEYSSSYSAFVFLFLVSTIIVVLSQLQMIPLFENHILPLQYTIILSMVAVVSLILAYFARKKSRNLMLEAQEEDLKLEPLINEFKARTDIPTIDESLSEEELFFLRNEWILSNLHLNHPDYTESYCDYVAEQINSVLFEASTN